MAKCGAGWQLTLSWVTAADGYLPEGALGIGQDVYVARAIHENEFVPGKFVPATKHTFIPYGGGEHPHSVYQVLCVTGIQCGKCYKWVPDEGGHVPKDSVVASIAGDGQPVYIARAEMNGQKVVGKVHTGHKNAYFPSGGKEVPLDHYEVLVWLKKG
ncbi:unnamed protein product [Echinostoma caproni]|uniref:DUF3421 domain-containing protein n=1 Tax=Echinostoma caproni TaxID=27848 RepID=A0A183AJ39_9TREM|nr:unnamed protein product [Echinostoma caproni]